MRAFYVLFYPAIWALNGLARLALHLVGLRPAGEHQLAHSEEELRLIVASMRGPPGPARERLDMVERTLRLPSRRARDLMVPRRDIAFIRIDDTPEKRREWMRTHRHARYPVVDGDIDHIVGVLYAKDLLRAVVRGEQKALREIARKPYFTPESNKVQDVLRDLRKNRVHMAIVVDEYGGTAGAVTIEDILEEIVGPIQDEYDIGEEDEIQFISPNEVVLDGRVSVDDVNELLKLDIAADDYDTIGGYVLNQLGAAPKVGTTLKLGNATLRVEAVQGTRIKKVRIRSETPFQIPEANQGQATLSTSPQPVRPGPTPQP